MYNSVLSPTNSRLELILKIKTTDKINFFKRGY